jgi:hypothetical protein
MIAPLLQTVEFLLKQRTTTTTTTKRTSSGEECNNNNNNNEGRLDDNDDNDNDDGGQLILSHIPRFCIPKNDEENDDDRGDGDSDIKLGEQQYDNQAYLDLEKFIQSEAIKVGLSLIETIRPHETLSNEYLFGNSSNSHSHSNSNSTSNDDDDNDFNDDGNDDDSMQQITLDNMKEAHAVVFIFNRTLL